MAFVTIGLLQEQHADRTEGNVLSLTASVSGVISAVRYPWMRGLSSCRHREPLFCSRCLHEGGFDEGRPRVRTHNQ